jgi:hypothetical protein
VNLALAQLDVTPDDAAGNVDRERVDEVREEFPALVDRR